MSNVIVDAVGKYLITAILGVVVAALAARVKSIKTETNATKQGLQSLLRLEIIHNYNKHISSGYCPIYAKEALEKAYLSYHDLGGNGTITGLYQEIQNLPTEPPKHKKEVK